MQALGTRLSQTRVGHLSLELFYYNKFQIISVCFSIYILSNDVFVVEGQQILS